MLVVKVVTVVVELTGMAEVGAEVVRVRVRVVVIVVVTVEAEAVDVIVRVVVVTVPVARMTRQETSPE